MDTHETDDKPSSSKPTTAVAAVHSAQRPAAARALEWLVRREALRKAQARVGPLPPVKSAHLARASAAASAAEKLVANGGTPPTDASEIASSALALSLYREAAYWALTASSDVDATDLASAMRTARADALVDAAGGEESLAATRKALVERSFRETAAMDLDAIRIDLSAAKRFVSGLLTDLDVRDRLIPTLRRERSARLAGAVAAVVALMMLLPWTWHRFGPNRVADAPWRASSATEDLPLSGVGFHPIEGRPNIFFHTREEMSPWIEFDLGATRSISYLGVQNRIDAYQERAVPLVFEVSTDHTHWTEVARQVEKFYTWHTMFASHAARYVRLRALRATMLHLGAVRVN